jgi:hypothetical protein
MPAVSITAYTNDITATVTSTSPCSGIVFITYKLYQNGSLYTTSNVNNTTLTFNDVPVGFDYYVIIDIYTTGPTFCDTATSNTVTITSFCIPTGATNMSMEKLARFYNITVSNVLLSGPNDPSTTGSIFGNSDLPNTGSPSKTRPNSISELRGRCGGIHSWSFWIFKLGFSNTSTTACQIGPSSTTSYYTNNETLTSTTSLWTDSALTTKVTGASGYYSNGFTWVFIDSSGNVTSSGTCVL